MKLHYKIFTWLLILVMFLPVLTINASATSYSSTNRLYGGTRVETSIEVSRKNYSTGSSPNVVLVGYHGEADALTGTLLASSKNAPILLVDKYEHIKDELLRLGVKNVYLLGGNQAIDEKIEQEIRLAGYKVIRINGHDRRDTALEVASNSGDPYSDVFLANDGRSGSLADALAIAPVSGMYQSPILLTSKSELPKETLEAMKLMEVRTVKIIGGTGVIDQKIEDELIAAGFATERIAGNNRWHTAKIIADLYFNPGAMVIANDGYNGSFADALVGGYVGAKMCIPLLLTDTYSLNPFINSYLIKSPYLRYVIGGEKAISHKTFEAIAKTDGEITQIDTIEQIEAAKYNFIKHDGIPKGKEIIGEFARNGNRAISYKTVIIEGKSFDNIPVDSKVITPPVNGTVYIGTGKNLDQPEDDLLSYRYEDIFNQSGWESNDFAMQAGEITGFTMSGRLKAEKDYKGLSLVLPEKDHSGQNIHTISEKAFKDFYFQRAQMPDTILNIEEDAFHNVNLMYTEFPNDIQVVGKNAFTVNNFSERVQFNSLKYLTDIGDYAFSFAFANDEFHRLNLESLHSLKRIGTGAFIGNQIVSVTLPDGLLSIGPDAFVYNSINQVRLPPLLERLGEHAFDDDVQLTGKIDFQ